MSDLALRLAGRSEDATRALAQRLRVGDVSPERVALAAALGHAAALELADPVALPDDSRQRAQAACEVLGHVESVRWACDLADLAIAHAWTDAEDTRPAEAVAAARAWADCPCEEHRQAARAAAAAAREAWTWPRRREEGEALATAWATAAAAASRVGWVAWAAADAVRSGAVAWPEAHAMLAERLLRGAA